MGRELASTAGDEGILGQIPLNKYDEYGAPASGFTGRFGFTGQMWIGELQLWHYKARAYNPVHGRFLQTDPIGMAGGLNLYAYVGNDPAGLTDPSGLLVSDCGRESFCYTIYVAEDRGGSASGGEEGEGGPIVFVCTENGCSYVYLCDVINCGDPSTLDSGGICFSCTGSSVGNLDSLGGGSSGYGIGQFAIDVGIALGFGALDILLGGPTGEGYFLAASAIGARAAARSGVLTTLSQSSYAYGTIRTVAGYQVAGNAGLVGSTYTINIWGLYRTPSSLGLGALSNAFRAEAASLGASRISILGTHISNPAISGLHSGIAARYGYTLQQVNPTTIILMGGS